MMGNSKIKKKLSTDNVEDDPQSAYYIPKDKAAWMAFIKTLVRKKVDKAYLSEQNLTNKIALAKRAVCVTKKYNYVNDPDLPSWYYWSMEQIGEWLEQCGLSHLKEMFLMNGISGRNFGLIDACALEKMGVKYYKDVAFAMKQIRGLQGFRYPNCMRSHTRRLAFEEFTKFNIKRGKTYDLYTFQKFCYEFGYPYNGKTAPVVIPETCPLSFSIRDQDNPHVKSDDSFDSMNFLDFAPSVEFLVRTIIMRNKIVDSLLDELLAAFPDEVEDSNSLKLEESLHIEKSMYPQPDLLCLDDIDE